MLTIDQQNEARELANGGAIQTEAARWLKCDPAELDGYNWIGQDIRAASLRARPKVSDKQVGGLIRAVLHAVQAGRDGVAELGELRAFIQAERLTSHNKPWTEADDIRLLAYRRAGHSMAWVAKQLGRTEKAAIVRRSALMVQQ